MRILFILCFFLTSFSTLGQEGKFIPFKLIIITPENAIIDAGLKSEIDSLENGLLKSYYFSISEKELLLNLYEKDTFNLNNLNQLKNEISELKAKEPQIKNYKYFHTISSFSVAAYQFIFNEYEPYSQIEELPTQNDDINSLTKLSTEKNADYILFFKNIHTETKDGNIILKLTTSLFSKKENKIILTKITEGDIFSQGGMWTCSNNLSCLLINAVRTSTGEVTSVLTKLQVRDK
jgi:hypothetical protein